MKVLEVMRVHVNTITADATLADAVDMMDLYQVVALPVVDGEGRPVGVVAEGDIARAVLPHRDPGVELATRRVAEVMTAPAVTVEDQAEVSEAAALLAARNLKRLPVTTDGKVVGTIGRIDIAQALLEEGC